jgi:glycine dehydrogenase subunit 2
MNSSSLFRKKNLRDTPMALPLIFEYDRPDLKCGYVPKETCQDVARLPKEWRRSELPLPQVAEPEVLRHFVNLSTLNHHVDKGFYRWAPAP